MRVFGYEIKRASTKENVTSPVQTTADESTLDINQFSNIPNASSYVVDFDKKVLGDMTENRLIAKYREISNIPLIDKAIEEIISDMIIMDGESDPIDINLDNVKYSENIKKEIREAFEHTVGLLHFSLKGHDIAKRWYIDGRLNYNLVIDIDNPKKGVVEVRYIDPKKIKKVREIRRNNQADMLVSSKNIKEYFMYSPLGFEGAGASEATGAVKLAKDSVTYATSGLLDYGSNTTISHLHKALRAANTLRMMEDSAVIYRLNNSTERRIFYIEVGNLPKGKASQYLRDISTKYKNKVVYDADTGNLKDDRKHLAVTEDFWIPRRSGQDGTQIDTLPAGQNLGEMEDVEYFKQNLYDALNVPRSRFNEDSMISRGTEISRDEMKFAQFIARLRNRFNYLFIDIIKKHLVLKGVMSIEDFESIENRIKFEYARDNYFAESIENQMLQERMTILGYVKEHEGDLFSRRWIQRNVLQMSDEQIDEMNKEIEEEKKSGLHSNEEENSRRRF